MTLYNFILLTNLLTYAAAFNIQLITALCLDDLSSAVIYTSMVCEQRTYCEPRSSLSGLQPASFSRLISTTCSEPPTHGYALCLKNTNNVINNNNIYIAS